MPSGSLYGIYGKHFGAISMKPGSMSISFTIFPDTSRGFGTLCSLSKHMLSKLNISTDVLLPLNHPMNVFLSYNIRAKPPLFLEAFPLSPESD